MVIRTIKISRNEESHYFRDTFFKENVKSSFSVFWGLTKKYALWIILIFLPVIFTATTFANSFEINSLPPGELGSMQSIDTTATTIMRWLSSMIAYVAMVMLIVVTYRYMLTYYLKYDYPDKSTKELLEKSRMMMRGNKAKALTITFTLIGWFLLFLIVVTIISLILNSIWQPVFFYYTTISTVPFWATVLSNCFIYFLSSLLVSYLNMTNYQLYMEQKPLELYNDGYLKPETNAKKYIWIVIGVFILIFIIYSLYEKFYL